MFWLNFWIPNRTILLRIIILIILDLSEVLFIATANNTTSIPTAVLDRIEPISMPSLFRIWKITIGERYTAQGKVKAAGISEGVLQINENVWPNIVRPLGYDAGIRTLERTIEGIVRRVARLIVERRKFI